MQVRQADAMAGVVGRHVLRQALNDLGRDTADTGNAYSRRIVHQATGMVLAQLHLSPDDARLVIQGHAFATDRSMMDVAQDVIDGRIRFSNQDAGIEATE
jgi:AmiR/NasT family two-component response regulator